MNQTLARLLASGAVCVSTSVLSSSACTRTTDRVIEPVGAGDASAPTPVVEDASLNPLTPIALPPEPREDFRLVRGNELGSVARELQGERRNVTPQIPGFGGSNGSGGAAGGAGTDQRPVGAGGHSSKTTSY